MTPPSLSSPSGPSGPPGPSSRPHPERPTRRRWLGRCACAGGLAAVGLPWLAGCSRSDSDAGTVAQPAEIAAATACSLDGMLLAEFPGPKGQIRYRHEPQVQWFCDTLEVLAALRAPEQVRAVAAAWVQDMARADWQQPRGHWIDAQTAWYVLGSRRRGSMGPTAAPFADESAAQAFVAEHGGRVLRLADIRPDMVDLSGGALHDKRM